MELGRHTEKAVVKYQIRGYILAQVARIELILKDFGSAYYHQQTSAIEYATARKLMNIEPEGTENV